MAHPRTVNHMNHGAAQHMGTFTIFSTTKHSNASSLVHVSSCSHCTMPLFLTHTQISYLTRCGPVGYTFKAMAFQQLTEMAWRGFRSWAIWWFVEGFDGFCRAYGSMEEMLGFQLKERKRTGFFVVYLIK